MAGILSGWTGANQTYRHRLVCLGDSITQGFQNGGIYRTDLSFPSFLAESLDPESPFTQPLFSARTGLPLNLEMLIRALAEQFGHKIDTQQYISAANHTFRTLKNIKTYWESGRYEELAPSPVSCYHNQSVWGFTISDAWTITEKLCRTYIASGVDQKSVFSVLPDQAKYITARRVLNPTFAPSFENRTLLDNVASLADEGGIENLIVNLGANNIIGAISSLRFAYSEHSDLIAEPNQRNYTVYRPEHFEADFRKLAELLSGLSIGRIVTSTIPDMSIPPVTNAIWEDRTQHTGGYADYYTRFWIFDDDFNPELHPHLTREQMIELDLIVAEYNRIIVDVAEQYGWIIVPLHRMVNALKYRNSQHNLTDPFSLSFKSALAAHPRSGHLVNDEGEPVFSTDYFEIDGDSGALVRGGIFSLDGMHPTTIGYGLMAELFRDVMEVAGVEFRKPLNWNRIIEEDRLTTQPPLLLAELRNVLRILSMGRRERLTELGANILPEVMELFSFRQ